MPFIVASAESSYILYLYHLVVVTDAVNVTVPKGDFHLVLILVLIAFERIVF
jgi:hypothetical protein